MKGAELIVKTLEQYGVTHIFGLPGDATPFFRALSKSPLKFVTMRNEQGVGYATIGYARAANKPGVAYVSRGPGGTNILTGIACARLEGTPALFIVDQVRRKESIYPDSYMYVNLEDIYAAAAKGVNVVWHAKDIPSIMSRSWTNAKSKTSGPHCIIIPQDVFNEDTVPIYIDLPTTEKTENDSAAALEKFRSYLDNSAYPIAILGPGVKEFAHSGAVQSFLEHFKIPFFTTRHAKGVVSEAHSTNYGVARSDIVSHLSPKIDLVITLGFNVSDKDDEYSWWLDRTKIKHLDISDSPAIETLYFQPAEKLCVRLDEFFRLAKEIPPVRSRSALSTLSSRQWQERCRQLTLDRFGDTLLSSVLDQHNLGMLLAPKDALVVETGLTRRYVLTAFRACGPQILGSMSLSALGFSIPASIGISLAKPEARVVALCGDGALLMSSSELATIRHLKLPIKIIVVADESFGYMKYLQQEAFGTHAGVDFTNPDFELLARAFGFSYACVRQKSDIKRIHPLIESPKNPALIVLYQKYRYI